MDALKKEEINIERDLEMGMNNESQNSNMGAEMPLPPRPDFISDPMLDLVLGYKNKYFVSVLGQKLGDSAKKLLNDLYKLSDSERKLYKTALQDFIREQFPDWEDKISKITNASYAGLAILELGRWHEAKTLIRADFDLQEKSKGAA